VSDLIAPIGPTRRLHGAGEALLAWIVARVLVFVSFAVADGIASVVGPNKTPHIDERLVTWDGHWYLLIARDGYENIPNEGLRFFPLYPMLARAMAWPFGNHELMLVILANVLALVALVLLRKLVLEETGDPDHARRSMWLLALFPAAGALVLAYSESLMLVLSLCAFLLIRRDRWWLVALAGALCGLTRPVGVLLMIPFAIEAFMTRKRGGSVQGRIAAIISPAAGGMIYLAWVGGEFGNWREPIEIQRGLRDGFQNPLIRFFEGFRDVATSSQLDAPNLIFGVIFIGLAVVAFRTQRAPWWAYAVATLVVALSANNIDSIGRYGLVAFPFIVALARVGEDERSMWAITGLSAGGLVALTTMSFLGAYTP
jgi:hypothetical protein